MAEIVYRKRNSSSKAPRHPVILHLFTRRSAFLQPLSNDNNNNNLLISSAQVSTIRFSNARYILDRDKHDVYNTLC